MFVTYYIYIHTECLSQTFENQKIESIRTEKSFIVLQNLQYLLSY